MLLPLNSLIVGDNLKILRQFPANSVDLIYLDPPFNSNRTYKAKAGSAADGATFRDVWSLRNVPPVWWDDLRSHQQNAHDFLQWMAKRGGDNGTKDAAYLLFMAVRMVELRRVLKVDGSLYLQCDLSASHLLRTLMDLIFIDHPYRNTLIWRRDAAGKGGKRTSAQYPRNYDVILYYAATNAYFCQPTRELTDVQKASYRYFEPNGDRYKAVQLGNYSPSSVQSLEARGLIHRSKSGKAYKKYYLKEARCIIDDMWTDIPGFGIRTNARERLGYPTQKPIALMKRIITASSRTGDVVLDPFCGGGTTCVAAQSLNRQWIGIDVNEHSEKILALRLAK